MHTTGSRPKLVVSSDGRGVINHAGSRLLADLADATGLTTAFTDALCQLRPRGNRHAPGRIAVDLAVMLADGGEAITDLALLRDQAEVFGPVASTATVWRLLAGIDPAALAALRAARAAAREVAWMQAPAPGSDEAVRERNISSRRLAVRLRCWRSGLVMKENAHVVKALCRSGHRCADRSCHLVVSARGG